MKSFSFAALLALSLIASSAQAKQHKPVATSANYCVWRVPAYTTTDYQTTKVECSADEGYIYTIYSTILLAKQDTSYVMTAPDGSVMYSRRSY
jgi:hypothetical protein